MHNAGAALKKVIREYLVSFRPGVAWSTLCLPRKFGGVGLVDIADQSLALHLIYLQRLLRPPSSSDFVTAWLVYAFQIYSGHKSILPWLSFPDKYKSRVSSVPVLKHLNKLLLKLPKLVPDSSWSSRWFLDFPLCCILGPVPSVSSFVDAQSLAPRYLFSNICTWQPDLGIVDVVTRRYELPRVLQSVDYAIHGLWGRPPTLAFTPLIASKIVLSQDNYYVMPRSVGATSWLPDCSHWCISNSSRSSVPVARISLGALRRYWHPVRDTITSRIGPPLKLPSHLLLSPASWRLFWSLSLPAKAFTPLWRLLHDSIGHYSWCHRIVPDKALSLVCALCGVASEELYHFVVGCSYKADYWRDVVSLLSLQDLLPTSLCIWTTLIGFCSLDMVELNEDVLVAFGVAYTTLWKHHWRSVIYTEPWISSVILNMVRQDHGSFFHSLFPSAGVQTGNLTLSLNSV
ncbi:hypothetical protein INT46_010476 [Mucor plumbeus]|uniref:Reverse transcriptase zinc-binding domain-containing protein n=1 Tax=Mucor plumbeus TaxID=97098 RepID=A0A8H7RLT9_9FUNG|nr:hypothetical protein INT46_010476 [Mucor plumbeus]